MDFNDSILYFIIGGVTAVLLILLTYFQRKNVPEKPPQPPRREAARVPQRRDNLRRGRRRDEDEESGEENEDAREQEPSSLLDELKDLKDSTGLGTKKKAKLIAKAEKKAQREVEDREREKRKIEAAKEDEERKRRDAEAIASEKSKAEELERLRREAAAREEEEYQKVRAQFIVESEGQDAVEDIEDLLATFVAHVKKEKVVVFEELATQFSLKVPEAIDRLKTLVEEGTLTGVFDDRGKFIYISEDELKGMAKWVKQRGRVSLADIVTSSASIINIVQEKKGEIQ